jgi:uncharacterized membrane protein YeaQ/YmgE (transglycosylase-associated protein family)
MDIIVFLMVGLFAGCIAGSIMNFKGLGLVGNIVIGIIGAFLGSYLFDLVGFFWIAGLIGSIIKATIGAVILLAILKAIQ